MFQQLLISNCSAPDEGEKLRVWRSVSAPEFNQESYEANRINRQSSKSSLGESGEIAALPVVFVFTRLQPGKHPICLKLSPGIRKTELPYANQKGPKGEILWNGTHLWVCSQQM